MLREVKEDFVLPVTVLPMTKLLLKMKDSFAGTAVVRACRLRTVLNRKAVLGSLLAVVDGTKDVVFSGLPVVFTINMTVNVTGGRGRITTLTTVVSFFMVGTAVGTVLLVHKSLLTSKALKTKILRKAIADIYKVRALRVNMFNNVVIKLKMTTLRGGFCGVRLPGTLSFFDKSEFIPVVSALACIIIKVMLCFM